MDNSTSMENTNVLCHYYFRSAQHTLDYDKALLVSRYLGSSRSFSKSFDGYLGQVLIRAFAHVMTVLQYCILNVI